jgi:hypothetical protein
MWTHDISKDHRNVVYLTISRDGVAYWSFRGTTQATLTAFFDLVTGLTSTDNNDIIHDMHEFLGTVSRVVNDLMQYV